VPLGLGLMLGSGSSRLSEIMQTLNIRKRSKVFVKVHERLLRSSNHATSSASKARNYIVPGFIMRGSKVDPLNKLCNEPSRSDSCSVTYPLTIPYTLPLDTGRLDKATCLDMNLEMSI